MYLAEKREALALTPDDPVADLYRGWDLHVEFGVQRPAFYTLNVPANVIARPRPSRPSGSRETRPPSGSPTVTATPPLPDAAGPRPVAREISTDSGTRTGHLAPPSPTPAIFIWSAT